MCSDKFCHTYFYNTNIYKAYFSHSFASFQHSCGRQSFKSKYLLYLIINVVTSNVSFKYPMTFNIKFNPYLHTVFQYVYIVAMDNIYMCDFI